MQYVNMPSGRITEGAVLDGNNYPLVTDKDGSYYYSPDMGNTWYKQVNGKWVASTMPQNPQNVGGIGMVCNKPESVVPITATGYVVTGAPVCLTPAPENFQCNWTACGPTIGVDCDGNLLVKTKYDGWYLCTGSGAWESLEIADVCPDINYLYFNPDFDSESDMGFWVIRGDAFWVYTEVGWVQKASLPCGVKKVILNTKTGKLYYYKTCAEVDMRKEIVTNPFCTTGYGR
jgi:hypothetical protein